MPGVPPRPPYSVGHWMPAKPALALSASHSRRIVNWSASDLSAQNSGLRMSSGRFLSSQLRSSLRNSSSASVKARSTGAPHRSRGQRRSETERRSTPSGPVRDTPGSDYGAAVPTRIMIVLLLLTGCTAGSSGSQARVVKPPASSSSSPSSSPTAEPSASATAAAATPAALPMMLAFGGGVGVLSLYSVAPGSHAASLVRRLAGPSGMHVWALSLSGGADPTVCAVWTVEPGDERQAQLRCYRPGATQGHTVATTGVFGGVSVRADGRALAWTEQAGNPRLVVADLS